MSDFDLDAHLKKIEGYSSGSKDAAKTAIRQEFARLSVQLVELDTYREIAKRQARQIAELSVALEAANKPATPVELSWSAIGAIGRETYEAIRRFHDEQAQLAEEKEAA